MYAIWDMESANRIGAYESEAEALADVRDTVVRFGRDLVLNWGLAWHDEVGSTKAIAEGQALIDLAFSVPA
jgi:hypothetical protein